MRFIPYNTIQFTNQHIASYFLLSTRSQQCAFMICGVSVEFQINMLKKLTTYSENKTHRPTNYLRWFFIGYGFLSIVKVVSCFALFQSVWEKFYTFQIKSMHKFKKVQRIRIWKQNEISNCKYELNLDCKQGLLRIKCIQISPVVFYSHRR